MRKSIKKAPATIIEVDMFRRGNEIYLDLEGEQYCVYLDDILRLEDLNKRSTSVSNL